MIAKRQTVTGFIARNRIRMTSTATNSNPNMPDSDNMHHWKVVLKIGRRVMSTHFSQGYGIQHDPTLPDVMDCLASEAAGYENARSFEDWAAEYGFDEDSRRAERIYKTLERQTENLKRLLGDDAYNDLLWNTERL